MDLVHGTVRWFDREMGFGFIDTDYGWPDSEIFFHITGKSRADFVNGGLTFQKDTVSRDPGANDRLIFSFARRNVGGRGYRAVKWVYLNEFRKEIKREADNWFTERQLLAFPFLPEVITALGCKFMRYDIKIALLDSSALNRSNTYVQGIRGRVDHLLVRRHGSPMNYSVVLLKQSSRAEEPVPIYRQIERVGAAQTDDYWLIRVDRDGGEMIIMHGLDMQEAIRRAIGR